METSPSATVLEKNAEKLAAFEVLKEKIWVELGGPDSGAVSCCEIAELLSDFEEKYPE